MNNIFVNVFFVLHATTVWPNDLGQRRRRLKNFAGWGSKNCNFPTFSCKLPTEEITGAQNFNFALKFSQTADFRLEFCIFGKKYNRKKKHASSLPPHTF